jgi:hypothetical protein
VNGIVAFFLVCAALAQFVLPRRLIALPLLMIFAWIPRAQVLELGDVKLTAFRLIIALGLMRVTVRREKLASGLTSMDLVWVLWAVCMIGTWTLHTSNDLAFRVGLVWDYLGAYFLLRYALSSYDDIERLFVAFCLVLVPVALLMAIEREVGANPFGSLGGLATQWREGKFRAAGPFAHPILAGTVGATCLLMSFSLWRRRHGLAYLGLVTGGAIVYASASSGPMMLTAFGICGLALWKYRSQLKTIRWALLLVVLFLQVAMNDPVYYLMAKIDVVGGSTGWHRSRLIQVALEHFDEWWLAGTDYTAHWMPTGIQANDQHTDITNHFLAMGVMGGLPLLITFALAILLTLRRVDREVLGTCNSEKHEQFLAWAVGALIVAHSMNFLSAYLFDQSILSFMILFACAGVIGHARSVTSVLSAPTFRPDPSYDQQRIRSLR